MSGGKEDDQSEHFSKGQSALLHEQGGLLPIRANMLLLPVLYG